MELKDFVEETLLQIIQGVKSAQEKGLKDGAIISPGYIDTKNQRSTYNGTEYTINEVEFEVELTVTEGKENKKGIGVAFGSFAIGGQNKSDANNTSLTKIKFSVPVGLPPIKTTGKKRAPMNVSVGRLP